MTVFALLLSAIPAFAAKVTFDIPAQPLGSALQAFSRQASVKVLYAAADMQGVQSQAVQGEMEPLAALGQLLSGTGFAAKQTDDSSFTVSKNVAEPTAALGGIVVLEELRRPLVGATVTLDGTEVRTITDAKGGFFFEGVPAGRYSIVIEAPGRQQTFVTDVVLRPGQRRTLRTTEVPAAAAGVVRLDPFRVSAERIDSVVELEPYEVAGRRMKPFTTGNLDIARTENDTQPYFIFDRQAIEQAGAVNMEDFLKNNLTMNAVGMTNSQLTITSVNGHDGSTSVINLRGLGPDKTLVLVNGRRMPGVTLAGSTTPSNGQSDINGIPLDAIERIEILPSSASGIYGGSAIGGVVNIVLKSDYQGGEIVATYETPADTHAPTRHLSASYGFSLENGRTHISLSGSWKDTDPMLWQDRLDIYQRHSDVLSTNLPTFITSRTSPALGSLPNIMPNSTSTTITSLALKSGLGTVPSRITHVPAGTSPTTPWATLAAGLIANAGQLDLTPPPTSQAPTGLNRIIGTPSETKSFRATVRRQMTPQLELMADFLWADNQSATVLAPISSHLVVPQASPVNPFNTSVRVRIPDTTGYDVTTRSLTRRATLSAFAKLPWDWIAALDLSHSENKYGYVRSDEDSSARIADLNSGVLNPFVDTLLYPLDMGKYRYQQTYSSTSQVTDYALRGSGPLPSLPWGQPKLTIGVERRIHLVPHQVYVREYPITVANSSISDYLERESITDSTYAEALVPLVKEGKVPGLHNVELQLSGRSERYEVDTGTLFVETFHRRTPPQTLIWGPNDFAGSPTNPIVRSKDKYSSENYTIGIKYQPVKELTIRASQASALLPPSPSQLTPEAGPDGSQSFVDDPITGSIGIPVPTIGGGNPNLRPQNSRSRNIGLIWEPEWRILKGLRVNVEYFRTDQFDVIGGLSAQQIVLMMPERVTRDNAGNITLVNTSLLNQFHSKNAGWDLSASYRIQSGFGTVDLRSVLTITEYNKQQITVEGMEYDTVGYHPQEFGGMAKYKASFGANWRKSKWRASWSGRYIDGYKMYGVTGGPLSSFAFGGGPTQSTQFANAQGSERVGSQIYHDLSVGYDFGDQNVERRDRALKGVGQSVLSGLSLQVGARNVFNKTPPLDAYAGPGQFYMSSYGDFRLRTIWVSVKKTF